MLRPHRWPRRRPSGWPANRDSPLSPLYRELLDAAFAGIYGSGAAGHLGFIFGRALGLNLGGAEDAVLVEFAVSQGLCTVLEGVGKRIAAGVGHPQLVLILLENELHFRANSLNRAAFHVPTDADPLSVGIIAHLR